MTSCDKSCAQTLCQTASRKIMAQIASTSVDTWLHTDVAVVQRQLQIRVKIYGQSKHAMCGWSSLLNVRQGRKPPEGASRAHLRLLSRLQSLHELAQDLRRLSSSSDGLLCLLAHRIVIAAAPC